MKKKLIPILILFALCLCAPICAHADEGVYSGIFTDATLTGQFREVFNRSGSLSGYTQTVTIPLNYTFGGVQTPDYITFATLPKPSYETWNSSSYVIWQSYTLTFASPTPLTYLAIFNDVLERQSILITYTYGGVTYTTGFDDVQGNIRYPLIPDSQNASQCFAVSLTLASSLSYTTYYSTSSTRISLPVFILQQPFDALPYQYGYDAGFAAAEDTFGIREYYARQEGYEQGHSDGYTEGKREGLQAADNGTLYDLFAGLFDALTVFLTSFINFEIFGVNLLDFFKSLITIVLIILIVKLVKGAG